MKSILSNERKCYLCGAKDNLHRHHIFYGTANRKLSEKFGCWVYLCAIHHNLTDFSVHFNRGLDLDLKQKCQREFQRQYGCTTERFVQIFGRSWL